eukprot:gnl/TRDRNA2_/TRDRNA2_162773_c0_seq1.p1 gnl/TRDRNA2_/TRDRNA2_162773_c0~~gnl/TRDRNA2_/TRDRNA2_162773_c0_seq1.p1  ORF type:complete len:480 (+),score=86.33 gnl/TRDRNA2_/TRDRNA2_162773_c0_seq1:35-1441(+)
MPAAAPGMPAVAPGVPGVPTADQGAVAAPAQMMIPAGAQVLAVQGAPAAGAQLPAMQGVPTAGYPAMQGVAMTAAAPAQMMAPAGEMQGAPAANMAADPAAATTVAAPAQMMIPAGANVAAMPGMPAEMQGAATTAAAATTALVPAMQAVPGVDLAAMQAFSMPAAGQVSMMVPAATGVPGMQMPAFAGVPDYSALAGLQGFAAVPGQPTLAAMPDLSAYGYAYALQGQQALAGFAMPGQIAVPGLDMAALAGMQVAMQPGLDMAALAGMQVAMQPGVMALAGMKRPGEDLESLTKAAKVDEGEPRGGDWTCECGNKNYASRLFCNMKRCQKPRPGIGEEAVKMRNQRAQQPGSWKCLCGNQNFPGRTQCNSRRCGLSQEQGMVELISDDGRRVNMRPGGDAQVVGANGAIATVAAIPGMPAFTMTTKGTQQPAPEGSWKCPHCNNVNWPTRTVCNAKLCGKPKPAGL